MQETRHGRRAGEPERADGRHVVERAEDFAEIAMSQEREGAAVGESSSAGTMRPFVYADTFWGFAVSQCDNSAGAASAKNVRLRMRGVAKLTVATAASAADNGAAVYATDDNTFTLNSSAATQIGKVLAWITSTSCWVYFEGAPVRSI